MVLGKIYSVKNKQEKKILRMQRAARITDRILAIVVLVLWMNYGELLIHSGNTATDSTSTIYFTTTGRETNCKKKL